MNKIYAIRFTSGQWAQGSGWKSTDKIEGAKLYGKRGTANQALSYHGASTPHAQGQWVGAQVVEIEVYPGGDEGIETLKKFYGVETLPDLINTQARHIERLQQELLRFKPREAAVQFQRA